MEILRRIVRWQQDTVTIEPLTLKNVNILVLLVSTHTSVAISSRTGHLSVVIPVV